MVTADAVMGLVIIGVLATVLIVAANHQRRAANRLAEMRGAMWAAEQAMTELQSGRAVNAKMITIEPVAGDGAPAGRAWARVRATFNDRSASLIGLVPSSAVPKGGAP